MITISNKLYCRDIDELCEMMASGWRLKNVTVLVTGATGLIGSAVVDVLMRMNEKYNCNIQVIAMGRTLDKIQTRFCDYADSIFFNSYVGDIKNTITIAKDCDYIIHAAGNAYPAAFMDKPVDTIESATMGMINLFEYGLAHKMRRLLCVSSGEVYGNAGGKYSYVESDIGALEANSARSCYPEAKRISECLCASYAKERGADYVITRVCHTYGPVFSDGDNRAGTQFFEKACAGKNIVMYSKGEQIRSYNYLIDTVQGIFVALQNGVSGEAYNIGNSNSIVSIANFAELVAKYCKVKVEFCLPDETESTLLSPIERAVLNPDKLRQIGYEPYFDIDKGIAHCIDIIKANG